MLVNAIALTRGLDLLVPVLFNIAVAGVFVAFGYFAAQRQTWAFVAGMSFYALDSVLSLFIQDWLSFAFHGYALFCLFAGLKLSRRFAKLQQSTYTGGSPLVQLSQGQ